MDHERVKLPSLHPETALKFLHAMQGFMQTADGTDNGEFCAENIAAVEYVQRRIIGELSARAVAALDNILTDTDQVTMGNGVNGEGQMYPDVKSGLESALALLKILR